MRTFAQKKAQPQKVVSSNPALSHLASPSLLRTLGNQAAQRLLQAKSSGLEVDPSTTTAPRDRYEQEANHVADKVSQTPESQRQREPLQTQRVQTNVVQQATPSGGNELIQRSPKKPSVAEQRPEQRFEEMAKWPGEAHRAWKRLNEVDRFSILWRITLRYGEDFAREFLTAAAGKSHGIFDEYYGRGVGPKPKKLVAKGFRLAQKDSVHEWWVHPTGKTVIRNFSDDKPSSGSEKTPDAQPSNQAPKKESQVEIEGTEGWPAKVNPSADREELFGPVVAERENADIAFGEGDAVRYEDGTIELFLTGTTKSYVFRPLPGGGYVVYDPDGRRLDSIWVISPEDIP